MTPGYAARVRPRPRFLYVGNSAAYFLTHRLPAMRALREAGYEVAAAVPEQGDVLDELVGEGRESTTSRIRALGFEVHGLPLSRGGRAPLVEARAAAAIAALYARWRPDLAYHATMKPVLYGGLAARATRVPAAIFAVTGLGYLFLAEGARARAMRVAVRAALRAALGHPNARVVFQNEDDREGFVRERLVAREQTRIIPGSGVDVDRFHVEPEPERPVVVLPSRLLWDKGVGELVAAARVVRARGFDARFALVGDPDPVNPAAIDRATLEGWTREGIVEHWGWRNDMPRVFAEATIVCLPSYREGMPKAVLEGLAAGRPVVTTDVPGCRAAVEHDVTGLLVPPRDALALADALCRLLASRELRARLGRAGRHAAEARFSTRVVIELTVRLCDELVGRR